MTPSELVKILDLEQLEEDLFRGDSPKTGWQRVFGGLVFAQALTACTRTAPDRPAHSAHGFFLRPGDPKFPLIYRVERARDGRSFTTRTCTAIQHGKPIFEMVASFHAEETGLEHALAMPGVASPQAHPAPLDIEGFKRRPAFTGHEWPMEFVPVEGLDRGHQAIWWRVKEKLPDSQPLHRAVLAYISDLTLLDTALVQHERSMFEPEIDPASLDHAIWFHRPFRADEWILYYQDSPIATGGRALAHGSLFDAQGALIATVMQEGLIRIAAL
jgi:acyl-CoA thioesterase-2